MIQLSTDKILDRQYKAVLLVFGLLIAAGLLYGQVNYVPPNQSATYTHDWQSFNIETMVWLPGESNPRRWPVAGIYNSRTGIVYAYYDDCDVSGYAGGCLSQVPFYLGHLGSTSLHAKPSPTSALPGAMPPE